MMVCFSYLLNKLSIFLLLIPILQFAVDVIRKIKSSYGVKRNWQGDPCGPKGFMWEGLNCSYDGPNPPRIVSL